MNFIHCFICAILSANNVDRHTKCRGRTTTTPSPDVICEDKLGFCSDSIVGEIKLYLSVVYQQSTLNHNVSFHCVIVFVWECVVFCALK